MIDEKKMAITLDGLGGAGKSTLAKVIAGRLGYVYVDTGALYRTTAVYMMDSGVALTDDVEVSRRVEGIDVCLKYVNGQQRVLLFGKDVTDRLRTLDVSIGAATVAKLPAVRQKLLAIQRALAKQNDIVMDGRDIGSVVLPDAQVKIFLTASVEERAQRRYKELLEKHPDITLGEVTHDIKARDEADNARTQPAKDAVIVDTTGNTLDESIKRILDIVQQRRNVL